MIVKVFKNLRIQKMFKSLVVGKWPEGRWLIGKWSVGSLVGGLWIDGRLL